MSDDKKNEDSFHQQMMNQAYHIWQKEENKYMSKKEFLNTVEIELGQTYRIAVILGNLIGQIYNGGFMQWHDNDYSDSAQEIINFLEDHIESDETFVKALRIITDARDDIEDCEDCRAAARTNFCYQETFESCCEEQLQNSLNRLDSLFDDLNRKEEFSNAVNAYLIEALENEKG